MPASIYYSLLIFHWLSTWLMCYFLLWWLTALIDKSFISSSKSNVGTCELTQHLFRSVEVGLALILRGRKAGKEYNKRVLFLDIGAISQTQPPRKDNCTKFQHFFYSYSFQLKTKKKPECLKLTSLLSVFSKADKNIPNNTKVSVEVTPPMNGVADVAEVQLFPLQSVQSSARCSHVTT